MAVTYGNYTALDPVALRPNLSIGLPFRISLPPYISIMIFYVMSIKSKLDFVFLTN